MQTLIGLVVCSLMSSFFLSVQSVVYLSRAAVHWMTTRYVRALLNHRESQCNPKFQEVGSSDPQLCNSKSIHVHTAETREVRATRDKQTNLAIRTHREEAQHLGLLALAPLAFWLF